MRPVLDRRVLATLLSLALSALALGGCRLELDHLDSGRFHPDGFAAAEVHGVQAKFQDLACQQCHGANLDLGGPTSLMSCDSCHETGWREKCTYCHGGTDDTTGAPRRDLDGQTEIIQLRFQVHAQHLNTLLAKPVACEDCHGPKPVNAMDTGHWFDGTPGMSEVIFAALNSSATYGGNGQCSNVYCHSNGQASTTGQPIDATVTDDMGAMTCESCHAGMNSAPIEQQAMSGEHYSDHLNRGFTCQECHASVSSPSGREIIDSKLHMDGKADVLFLEPLALSGVPGNRSCTGTCHGDNHNDSW